MLRGDAQQEEQAAGRSGETGGENVGEKEVLWCLKENKKNRHSIRVKDVKDKKL